MTERERALTWLVESMIGWHQAQILPDVETRYAFLLEHTRRSLLEFTVHFGELRPAIDLINDELYKGLCSLRLRAQLRGGNMEPSEIMALVSSIVERYSPISSNPSNSTEPLQ